MFNHQIKRKIGV